MLVVLGIVLVVVGAIITFAVDAAVEEIDLVAVGVILMIGGGIALIAAAIRGAAWNSAVGSQKFKHERHVSADGRHIVEETESR